MANTPTMNKPLRMALMVAWRSKGLSRPRYGLVDDEELMRTGKANFLCTDGQQMPATLHDLLLLPPAALDVAGALHGVMAAESA
jgi:hypothetical protein